MIEVKPSSPTGPSAHRRSLSRDRRQGHGFLGVDEIAFLSGDLRPPAPVPQALDRLRLQGAWSRAVGAPLRVVARPARCESRRLIVDVRDPAWKRELERLKPEILKRLDEVLPGASIGDIAFRVRSEGQRPTAPPGWAPRIVTHGSRDPIASAPAGGEVSADLAGALACVSDHALRRRLGDVMGRYLTRRG